MSEYIRDLVRRDFEREEARRWDSLHRELKAGMDAPEPAFKTLRAEDILREAGTTKRAEA